MKTIKVLLIEDNLGDKRLFDEMIKDANLEMGKLIDIYFKDSLDSDLEDFLKKEDIDIVFLDLGLPGSSGEETVLKFRRINKDLPLVAYTGMNDISFGTNLLNIGCDDYICKADATSSIILKTILLNLQRYHLKNELLEKETMLLNQSRSAAMGDMISMIAHQWKQPLSVLSMIVNNMILDVELEEYKKENFLDYANQLNAQIVHLSVTIDDFKNFFSPNKQKVSTTVEKVLNDTLNIIGKSLYNNDIRFESKIEYKEKIDIYPNELVQVLINIIKNAKEALEINKIEDKKISLFAFETNNNLHIEIEDNAGGIKKDILDRIFEPYYTTKEDYNGTGIGLYISKTIIQKHFKGTVTVENKNSGANFIICIPLS